MRILVLEDEKKINNLITLYATQEGHIVESAFDANRALTIFEKEKIDLVITDLMLKGMSGERFIELIRARSNVYIIALTAKTTLESKLDVLSKGADDYIYKPFAIDELIIKLRHIERRLRKEESLRFSHGSHTVTLKRESGTVHKDGAPVDLKHTEMKILRYLMENEGRILSREQIIDACLEESEAYDRIVDVYIKNIRKKTGLPTLIRTVYGAGYKFEGDKDA